MADSEEWMGRTILGSQLCGVFAVAAAALTAPVPAAIALAAGLGLAALNIIPAYLAAREQSPPTYALMQTAGTMTSTFGVLSLAGIATLTLLGPAAAGLAFLSYMPWIAGLTAAGGVIGNELVWWSHRGSHSGPGERAAHIGMSGSVVTSGVAITAAVAGIPWLSVGAMGVGALLGINGALSTGRAALSGRAVSTHGVEFLTFYTLPVASFITAGALASLTLLGPLGIGVAGAWLSNIALGAGAVAGTSAIVSTAINMRKILGPRI